MDKIFLQLLMQFIQALVAQQVNKTVGQGYAVIPSPNHEEVVKNTKQAMADHLGVDVAELEAPSGSGTSRIA